MKRTGWIWALLLAAGHCAAADYPEGALRVAVRSPFGATGEVRAALCSSLAQFLDREPPAQVASQAAGTPAALLFTNLLPGTYALKAYLDLNGNQKLDRNWRGYPREPWALSKGVRAKPARTSWERAVFPFNPSASPSPPPQTLDLKP